VPEYHTSKNIIVQKKSGFGFSIAILHSKSAANPSEKSQKLEMSHILADSSRVWYMWLCMSGMSQNSSSGAAMLIFQESPYIPIISAPF
jgi:hypothetical protein